MRLIISRQMPCVWVHHLVSVPAESAPYRHKASVFYAKSCVQWWLVVPVLWMHVKLIFCGTLLKWFTHLFNICCTCAWSTSTFCFWQLTSSLLKHLVPLSDTSPRWRIPSMPCTEIMLNLGVGSSLNEPFDALSFLLWSPFSFTINHQTWKYWKLYEFLYCIICGTHSVK